MCYIVAHDNKKTSYDYGDSSIGDSLIPKNITTEAL